MITAKVRTWLATELRSTGTRQVLVTLIGNLAKLALSFGSSVVIARSLNLTDYGLLALVSTTLTIADTLGDLGLTLAAVRSISRAQESQPDRVRRLTAGYFSLAFGANIAAMVLGEIFAGPIAQMLLGRPEAEPYIRVALIGLLPSAGSGFVITLLQAARRFGALASLQVFTTITYLIGIGALVLAQQLSIANVILIGVLNPIVGFVVGLRLLSFDVPLRETLSSAARRTWPELIAFGKWLWLSTLLNLFATRLDLVLLGRWVSVEAVGLYALAFNLATKLDIVNRSRLTVLLPHVSTLHQIDHLKQYSVRSLRRSLPLACALLLILPCLQLVITIVYGAIYLEAVPALSILVLVVALDLVTAPLTLLAYPLNQPWVITASDALRVAMLIGFCVVLIPPLGLIGAALARLISNVIGTAFALTVYLARIRRLQSLRIETA